MSDEVKDLLSALNLMKELYEHAMRRVDELEAEVEALQPFHFETDPPIDESAE